MRTFRVLLHAPFESVAAITCVTFGFQNLNTVAPQIVANLTTKHCQKSKKEISCLNRQHLSVHIHKNEFTASKMSLMRINCLTKITSNRNQPSLLKTEPIHTKPIFEAHSGRLPKSLTVQRHCTYNNKIDYQYALSSLTGPYQLIHSSSFMCHKEMDKMNLIYDS